MSFLAIGAVTGSIAELLNKKLNKPPLMGTTTTFRVTTLPPDDDRVSEDNGVNLFLYKVTESPFRKNMNWRGDRSNPVMGDRPALALSLDYLVTAYAKKVANSAQDDITAHQLLGNAMAVLHDFPVLNDIHDGDFDASVDTQFPAELRDSFEKVKVSLLPTTMEEFSKIWTGLTKPYRLSVVYQVSLVEIAPTVPTRVPAPSVQVAAVGVNALGTPQIASIQPAQGPAGAQVVITGQGFQSSGGQTVVTVGGIDFAESDLISISPQKIVLNIPASPQTGPRLAVTVSVEGTGSPAASYLVTPWIDRIVPLRGIPGIPLQIPFTVPSGATVSVRIDGQVAATTVDPQGKVVTAIVPLSITSNGPKSVVLVLNDGSAKTSNALSFDVLPLITAVNVVTVATPAQTTVTLAGERLAGADTVVNIGGLSINVGANANSVQLAGQVNRVLAVTTPVSTVIDGRESNALPSLLLEIHPQAAFAGDTVNLVGSGLSGRNIVVSFGAATVNVGPQPFGAQFSVKVPGTLVAGAVPVKATIDGRDTNTVPFTVSG
jgi:hypothetical protein